VAKAAKATQVVMTPGPSRLGPGAARKEADASDHICVSIPWPLGVLMLSQVPLATYFQ
jgi:hypothetical protein